MKQSKVKLVIHPTRLQILQTLSREELTTQEIADRLPSLPKSSIYRHLRMLLDGGLLTVATTRPVKGIEEKVYRVNQSLFLTPEDMAGLSDEDHLHYFTNYVISLLHGFGDYLASARQHDLAADRVGYSEAIVYADDGEIDNLGRAINEALGPLIANPAGSGRKRRKIALITHPVPEGKG